MDKDKTQWRIWVSGYGEFAFEGSEAEAEEMRVHKARWERGSSRKWRADLSRECDRLTAEVVGLWDAGEGVPQSLLSRLRKAEETATLPLTEKEAG